ncbi:hypothetical protein SLEP1_g7091 [Rubroshorea leprosula]|uniref:Uncharacterized protein n=1 Tax=Rubroshorea leprosula TaxID=152421 RepID=A0AAV5HXL0_9ROSI|nr:hypothetical protein SLEP1_g7091 [Rubroshorea leprosula]
MEEQAIIFQAVVPIGESRSMMNAWFKIQPKPKISGPFHARQPPFRLGISSAFVGSSLYTIGGRVPNHFVLSDCISWLDTSDAFSAWKTNKLPSRCVDSVLGVYSESLYIFPGVWKYGYYHMDEDKYLTNRKGYIWSTRENKCLETKIGPPKVEGEKWQWRRIRACAALDKEGLLIAMDGEKNNFFLYKPEKNDWEICKFKDPLPKFIGETSFAASNGRLYFLEVQGKFPALLYIYDIKEGKLVIDKTPILELDDDLWSMDEWDRVVRLVLVADDKLCLLWLGPVSYENENGWPPARILHYLKFKVSSRPNSVFEVEDSKVFTTSITDLLDCLPCDLAQFEAEAKGKSQPLTQDVKLKAVIASEKKELVIDPVTTMAARENAILFQAVVPSGERKLMMNTWFKIQPTAQIFGPFHGRQPFRLGISSTFVGSSLYTIGGEVPSSRLPKPCDVSWLDTCHPFNGWETGELPSPCVDSVICVAGDSLYILTELEGYIWNTRDNQCLKTRIHPPRVEGGDQKQRPRVRACAALDGQKLLIAMDGENNTNFYLHPQPEDEARDWERFGTPLPAFTNEISFAASNGRLYILEFPNNPPASLHIYDTNMRKIVQNYPIDWLTLNALWKLDEKDRVVRLVPVADDMLCFLLLGPFEDKNGWPPVKTLYYLKLKFSFNLNEFEIVDDKSFHTNITHLLNCLPCGPEQFRAEVDPDASQKQPEDNASAKAIGTSLISDRDQAENTPSPEGREREGKRESTQSSQRSDAETEELLDRMLTWLALCDDSKLEALLSKLLPLTISSLSSQSLAVYNKVLEILSHVNKRVKHQPEIGLPLMDLWKMYSELNAPPMVKNFCIIYVEMAFERINLKEKENMAPMVLTNISKLPQQHQEIIMRIAVKEQSEVRFCAVRWATSLFGSQHCPSRFICMLGAADARLDIREMALEGLYLGKGEGQIISQNLDCKYPLLGGILEYILTQQPRLLESSERREQKLLFPSEMYVAMIKFLLNCFVSELAQNKFLGRSSDFLSSVERMCLLLEHAMALEGSFELHSTVSKALVTLGSHLPEMIASHFALRVPWLKQLLNHMDLDTRESAARLLGIASSALPNPASCDLICELVSSIRGANKLRFEAQHGALSAIGYVTADSVYRTPSIPEELFQNTLKCLIDVVSSESGTLASIAMQALGHIGLCAPLSSVVVDSGSVHILEVLQEKLSKLLSGDDIKAIQKIVISLGHVCVKETSSPHLHIALILIFSLCRSKAEEILFAAGEALSFLWGGVPVTAHEILKTNYTSLSMSSNFLTGDMNLSLSNFSPIENSGDSEDAHIVVRDTITKKLFNDLLYSNRKEECCAGTVWLVSLTMYCGHHSAIQKMLPEIQEAFSHLLGEQNELTQELASQGMSIVYELGDESMKKNLVDSLVGTLTGSGKRKRAIKLAKGAGIALRPHLSDLVCCMLESLSSLEDQGLNYVELHAANVGIQTEKLESLRLSIAKGSPMWETLDLCINVVDSKSLDGLVPRLAHLVRSGVGLNTRVGVATFIYLLVQKVGVDIRPYTSMLSRLLFPAVKEGKSTAAKRAFAAALAIILKYAAPSQAQKLIEDTTALHIGDRNAQISCAFLLKSYSSTASDVLSGYHAAIIPVIFISRFEDDKHVSGVFAELWEDSSSGDRVTVQLYLEEIVSLICESITSSSWASKKKSAQAICKLSEVLGDSLSSYHRVLLDALMKEIPGRIWEGKDALLVAIGALCTSCHKAISTEDHSVPIAILSLVSSACTKKVKKFREASFSCLDQVIEAFGDPEFFNHVFPMLLDMCNSASVSKTGQAPLASDTTKAESDDIEDVSVPLDKVMNCITSCIHVARVNDILEQKKNLMHVLLSCLSPGLTWTVKVSAFPSIKELCLRLYSVLEDSNEAILQASATCFVQELLIGVAPKIIECIITIKIAQVHVAASECLLEITKLCKHISSVHWTETGIKGELLNQIEAEKNEQAKSLLRKCVEILENLEQANILET